MNLLPVSSTVCLRCRDKRPRIRETKEGRMNSRSIFYAHEGASSTPTKTLRCMNPTVGMVYGPMRAIMPLGKESKVFTGGEKF